VQVRFYATFRPIVGGKHAEVPLRPDATVQELVDAVLARWPALREHLLDDDGGLSRRTNVFIDGRSVRWLPEGLATVLSDSHEVDIFPAVAGG